MKKENRLLTIDGETLMSQPLTPLNFVVDTLLSQGLHILAGSPKVGKSWLALWLAVTVAKGDPVWGMGVKQGTTLYLCLEDSTLRIQNRLFEITDDAPASVHFTTNSNTLGKGLEEQLRAFLAEHPDTVLVIIDTLQMIRGTALLRDLASALRRGQADGGRPCRPCGHRFLRAYLLPPPAGAEGAGGRLHAHHAPSGRRTDFQSRRLFSEAAQCMIVAFVEIHFFKKIVIALPPCLRYVVLAK